MNIHPLMHPKRIVQVFSRYSEYTKQEYRHPASAAKKPYTWPDKVLQSAGYVADNHLFLAQSTTSHIDFVGSDVLLLKETTGVSLRLENTKKPVEMFKISRKEEDLWLSLNYLGELFMGYPRRENFDIMPLTVAKPVRICINGRTWHSMTGRRDHTYHEWDFIFEYMGLFSEAIVLPKVEHWTALDVAKIKTIDLRKDLY